MGIRLLLAACVGLVRGAPLPGEQYWAGYTYDMYVGDFGKEASPERQYIFNKNLDRIIKHNSDPSKTWYAGVNEFTDWTNAEFRAKRAHGTRSVRPALGSSLQDDVQASAALVKDVPESVDWREKAGVVTPVKNQGGCGSCWAFSATETLESFLAIATGKPAPKLSPQQLVSCVANPQQCGGTGGCDGATQELGFNYTETAGLTLDDDYPYAEETGTCKPSKIKPVAQNSGFVKLPANNYSALVSAVAHLGPIAISVAAGSFDWQMYEGGVYSGKCGWDQDHAVQLVGYGVDGEKMYWLVRNSWGHSWGEKGYIRIRRYGDGKEPCGLDKTPQDGSACKGQTKPVNLCGLCGILSDSSYPTGVKQVSPGPTPGPSPGPTPGPTPGPPGCKDSESKSYCKFAHKMGACNLLAAKCLETCGCCVEKPPDYCNGPQDSIVV